jgi:hypothetical protein
VLEKAGQLGEHFLSGAVVNPRALCELFPGLSESEVPLRGQVTDGSRLVVHTPNCVDCKATDVLGPLWIPRKEKHTGGLRRTGPPGNVSWGPVILPLRQQGYVEGSPDRRPGAF